MLIQHPAAALIPTAPELVAANAVSMPETQSPAAANIAGIGEIFRGTGITQLFNAPGLRPSGRSAHARHSGYA